MRSATLLDHLAHSVNASFFAFWFVVLRVTLGVQFVWAGVQKLTADWSAEGYLQGATGPFAETFQSMAGSGVVDALNVWGGLLIGLALIFGLFVRPASFFGAILMALYYLSQFEQNTAHGFVDFHVVYVVIFLLFMTGGAGSVFGLDWYLHNASKNRFIQWIAR